MTDWSAHTVKLPHLFRKLTDASNEQNYVEALAVVVEMRNELGLLKTVYLDKVFGEHE